MSHCEVTAGWSGAKRGSWEQCVAVALAN